MDKDLTVDDIVGEVVIKVSEFMNFDGRKVEKVYPLKFEGKEDAGTLK